MFLKKQTKTPYKVKLAPPREKQNIKNYNKFMTLLCLYNTVESITIGVISNIVFTLLLICVNGK